MDLDRSLGRALLRVVLGLNLTVHGLVRVPNLGKFAAGMTRDFGPTLLSSGLVHAFAVCLPFFEATIGLLLIGGIWQRAALVAGSLLMLALVFGTALLQRWDVLTQQMLRSLRSVTSRAAGEDLSQSCPVDWLRQVSVETRLERTLLVLWLPPTRHRNDDDLFVRRLLSHLATRLVPVDSRHADVHEHDVGFELPHDREPARRVVSDLR
jgi:thiosulfate dehydrogenase (quinone) large subunit